LFKAIDALEMINEDVEVLDENFFSNLLKKKEATADSANKTKDAADKVSTDLNDPNIAYTGKTVVHQNDNYDKRMGRYLSFSKAVSQISDPSERKELWSEILATGLITTKQIIK
jgi:hypothetical protein